MRDPPHAAVYQLTVVLRGVSPLIWCRFLVRADTAIADLHHILQLVIGWTNSHLHRFVIHGKEYGIASDGGVGFDDDPRQIRLADFRFRLRERFLYEYDFNDHWHHDIRVEQILPVDVKRTSPVCLGGKRAALPEECGGVEAYLAEWRHWKYDFLCRRLRSSNVGGGDNFFADNDEAEDDKPDYDPDHFDRRQVNAWLRRWAARGGKP